MMQYSKMFDISTTVSEDMAVYKGDPLPAFEWAKKIPENASFVTRMSLGAHTGTHVDTPLHFKAGAASLDQVPLSAFVGESVVIDATAEKEKVTLDLLKKTDVKKGDIVLLKTRNSSEHAWREDFIYLDVEAAAWLAKTGVKTVGVDGLSVDKFRSGSHPTHHALLDHDVNIIEGLRLRDVAAGRYFLVCLPLKLKGREAAPARAVLFQ
ncbi:cyclase family protein [Candidatus Micrarchaeota archaeon]|nr:cyclase family protein [Candidatus Micrarchaeota archaeon]